MYRADHGHTLFGLLLPGADNLREGDGEHGVDESMSMDGFASSEASPPKDIIAQTCWTGVPKEPIRVLNRAISFLLKPLKAVGEGGFETEVSDGKIKSSIPRIMSYSCNIPAAKKYICSLARSCRTANLSEMSQHM